MIKKIFLLGLCVIISGCGASRSIQKQNAVSVKETGKVESKYTGPKRRVAVVDFENKAKYGVRLGSAASDILITELGKSGKFIIVEREKLGKILEEQKFALSGLVDTNTAVEVGRMLGANAIVTGSITDFGVKTESSSVIFSQSKKQTATAVVDIRVVDVETGRIIYTDSGKGIAEKSTGKILGVGSSGGYDETLEGESLRAAIVKFTENIMSQINTAQWSCGIADVEGEKIYLNAGVSSGIAKGAKLTVFKVGREILDPTSGAAIGRIENKCGQVEVTDFFGEDGSTAKIISGTAEKGDRCRLNE